MRKTRFFARITLVTVAAAIIISSAFALFACNRGKITLDDIFKSTSSYPELSGYKQELTLPVGWEVYTPTVTNKLGSDTGYVKSLNAFIIVKYVDPNAKDKVVESMSLYKCDDKRVYAEGCEPGMVFPMSLGIIAMRIKGNTIVCKFSNGDVGAFDVNGRTAISRTKISLGGDDSVIRSTSLDNVIKILDDNLIAVHTSYDKGPSGYTSIYRPTYSGEVEARGELVCRVANGDNALSYLTGFDGKYVTVVGNKTGDCVYLIPAHANGTPQLMKAGANATLVDGGQENYDSEITYLGGGRFFMVETWTVSKSDEYIYTDGSKYWTFSRYIYTPDNDKLAEYTKNRDKVFMNMSNKYYDATKTGFDTKAYMKDGYIYASYGLFIVDKVAYYDQYILDGNLDIVMSLTGNFGITIKDQTKDKVGVYDLIMVKTDGYYYIPLAPSEVNIYDSDGKRVGHNDRTTVLQQELSNNVIVAGITDPDDDKEVLYGAFNIRGEEIIEFKYTSLSAFRGSYTIGERMNDKNNKELVLLGEDGREIKELSNGEAPFNDMVTVSTKPLYKIGCYVFKQTVDGTTTFGVKNFNPNVNKNLIMPATMKECTLYAPNSSPSDVFVFEKVTSGENYRYHVYRLV